MTTPRRYVRVKMHHAIDGLVARYFCDLCSRVSVWTHPNQAAAWALAHVAKCQAIAAVMERDQLRVELDRMRADRDRLRDRLNQINPLNKDNDR